MNRINLLSTAATVRAGTALLLLLVCTAGGSLADETAVLRISPDVDRDNLAAAFINTRLNAQGEGIDSKRWVLSRTDDRVRYQRDTVSDVWEKNGAGEVIYLQVYHQYDTYIEYHAADLRHLGDSMPGWQQLESVFDPAVLATMEVDGNYQLDGREVQVYTGLLQGIDTTVHWIVDLQLPRRIEYRAELFTQVMELESVYSVQDSPWPQWDKSAFFGMDYVDMGDNENHPLVRALNANAVDGHQGHSH